MDLQQHSRECIQRRRDGKEQRDDAGEKCEQTPAGKPMRNLPVKLPPAARVNEHCYDQSQEWQRLEGPGTKGSFEGGIHLGQCENLNELRQIC
jgi:hypothetical protein